MRAHAGCKLFFIKERGLGGQNRCRKHMSVMNIPQQGKQMFIFRKRIGFDNAFMSRIFRMQNLKPAEVIRDLCICTLINQMFCKILQIHGTSPVKNYSTMEVE